jgi:hypothetical protein
MHGLSSLIDFAAAGTLSRDSHLLSLLAEAIVSERWLVLCHADSTDDPVPSIQLDRKPAFSARLPLARVGSAGSLCRLSGENPDNAFQSTLPSGGHSRRTLALPDVRAQSNFSEEKKKLFFIPEGLAHLEGLDPDVRATTLEYIRRAPSWRANRIPQSGAG